MFISKEKVVSGVICYRVQKKKAIVNEVMRLRAHQLSLLVHRKNAKLSF